MRDNCLFNKNFFLIETLNQKDAVIELQNTEIERLNKEIEFLVS